MASHLVVGGGVAATQAAEAIRSLRADDEITLVAEEERPFYMRPLLADFVAGRLEEQRLWRDFETTAASADIKIVSGKKASGINRSARALLLDDGTQLSYDKLLVATGVKPRIPTIRNVDLEGVTPFSTIAHARQLREWAKDARRAVVVGRGLQGVELARALHLRGLQVTLVVPDESPWFPHLFQIRGELIEKELEQRGVTVIALDRPADLVGRDGKVTAVVTQEGRELPADIVGFAVDHRVVFDFLVGSGISLADGVIVDSRLQTTDPNVYAAGDCAQLEQEGVRYPLGYGWLRAMEQGEAAGRNMAGGEAHVRAGDESEAQALYGASLLARWQ